MIVPQIERANQLIQLHRFDDAEQELRRVLSSDPNNVHALALFALCQCENGRTEEAISTIKSAVSQEPDNAFHLYLYALFLYRQERSKEAEIMIRNAISFEPHNAEFFGLLASIHLSQKNWKEALQASNHGLEIDPDNITCLNLRSTSLVKLNKKEEAYSTIERALMNDPENETTHANLGWGLLEKGESKKALEHFSTSLRINPDSDYAKAGLVEGLKARYLFYRLFLKYVFFISNLKAKGQWMVIIGLYVGIKILQTLAEGNAALAPVITPIIYIYIAFALSTWIMEPLSNLFLRLNVYGRYALNEDDIQASNYVGLALCVGIAGGILYLFDSNPLYLLILVYGVTMMIPLASMFNPKKPTSRRTLIVYAVAMALIGIGALAQAALTGAPGVLGPVYVLGIVAYGWVANALIIK